MSKFDFLAALLDFGLTHVVEGILELLEVEDVAAIQLVSKLWYAAAFRINVMIIS